MLDVAVSRALSTEPEHRYKTAAELREALEAALQEPEVTTSRRKLAARGLASAVALAVIGVVAIGAARPEVRQKAALAVAPMMDKVHALQARAAERLHGSHAALPPAQLAAAAGPATVTVAAAPEPIAPSPTPEAVPAAPLEPAPEASAVAANDDGEVEDDSATSDSPAPEKAEPAAKAESNPASDAIIAEAHKYTAQGNQLKALNLLRHAAKKSPSDAKILQELASAAEHDHAWGEAVRTARRWVAVDPSSESKLELARLERKTGHRARALDLARSVVKDNPDSPEAHALLSQLGGAERVALQK